jgi:hypothetical protein
MILWFLGASVFLVWNVFQSSGLDFRLIAAGSLLPLVVDLPFGEQAYAHSLLSAVVVLVVAMAATIGRGNRLRRRRALSLAIGWFVGLVLGAAWANKDVFWWPFLGARGHAALLPPWPAVLVEELAGLAALWWAYTRFGLEDPARRRVFARTGRLTVATRA